MHPLKMIFNRFRTILPVHSGSKHNMTNCGNKKLYVTILLLFLFCAIWNIYDRLGKTVDKNPAEEDELRRSFDEYDSELWLQKNSDKANSETAFDDSYISDWEQDDPRLIEHIRRRYLHKPVDQSVPYNLSKVMLDYSLYGASLLVNKSLGGRRNGFFVESGAYDGEEASNTLFFEIQMGWTGLLIEPQPDNYKRLLSRNRKAWLLNGCIHGYSRPKIAVIYATQFASVLETYMDDTRRTFNLYATNKTIESARIWCFPLYSLLLALNQTKIDYFSLDVEGGEFDILANLPFDKLSIKVLQMEIEWVKFKEDKTKRDKALKFKDYMKREHPEFKEIGTTPLDVIYMS